MNYNEAGRVIGAGGFGCVFYPSLRCKNKKMGKNLISKLSIKKEVEKEQAINDRIKPIVLKIKDHNKYFLINSIFSCSPKPLNKKDLENFNKCVTLLNAGYTQENINKNLDKFDILNVPYGGEDLSDILVEKGKVLKEYFIFFNKKFIDLLENAIYPMNKLGLIHCDMKSSNLLIDLKKKDTGIKIIDWALSNIISKSGEIPLEIRYRTIQFNLPFSTIIFTKGFKENYKLILDKYPNSIKEEITGSFLVNMIKFYNNKGFIFIIKYLTKILIKYTNNNNELNEKKYFFDVFSKNVDIWGFLTLYLDIILITKNYQVNRKPLINLVKKYLYSEKYATNIIPENKLIEDLKKLKLLTFNKTKKLIK